MHTGACSGAAPQKMLDFEGGNGDGTCMMDGSWSEAVVAWREVVGAENVWTAAHELAPYLANASGLRRRVPAVIRPGRAEEVRAVVVVANRFGTPLYPVSTGRNLGLGSRLPVRDDQAILDLGRMNRILEVNAEQHYAVVEPGVTQGQLADHLAAEGLPLMVNCTGAPRDTSLIGNTLERGIGYFATRAESLTAMEVVLGSGKVVRTGFGHLAGARTAHIYRHGIGPDLGGLFSQSNFGVVTSAGVPLMPRPECQVGAVLSVAEDRDLPGLIDALRKLREQNLIQTVAHVGNRHRTHLAVGTGVAQALAERGVPAAGLKREVEAVLRAEGFGAWSAVWGIMGTRRHVRNIRRETARALRGMGKLVFLSDGLVQVAQTLVSGLRFTAWARRKALILPGVIAHFGLSKGTPTDEPLKSMSWALGVVPTSPARDPDREGWGLLYCLPFVPLAGVHARDVVARTEAIYGRYGFDAFITFNLVDDRALEAVINLVFDTGSEEQCARAHAASRALHEEFIRCGWMPYRVGVQDMGLVVHEDSDYWKLVRELKSVMDPNGIMAPGRYNLA